MAIAVPGTAPASAAVSYPGYGSVMIAASSWLQGMGTPVVSNGQRRFDGVYQCSELAKRLYAANGWPAVRAAGNGGAAFIPEGSTGLFRFAPGTGYVPAPGDLIIENTRTGNPYGHVSVVDHVLGRTVHAVEQNGSASGRHTYTLGANMSLTGGYGTVKAIMHAPTNGMDTRGGLRNYGDWDGNGSVTPGVVHRTPTGLKWQLSNTHDGSSPFITLTYGHPTDIPVVGNWDGRGGDTIGVARRVRGVGLKWVLAGANVSRPVNTSFVFGLAGDQPVVGNWDGVGGDSIGVVRRVSTGVMQWLVRNSNSAGRSLPAFTYGQTLDQPVVGNWDGRGGDGIAVVRRERSILHWYLRNSPSTGNSSLDFGLGLPGDYAVAGDWDGRGGDTPSLARPVPGNGVWWALRNGVRAGSPGYYFSFGDERTALLG